LPVPHLLGGIGAVGFLRFQRIPDEAGQLGHGTQMQLDGITIAVQLLLQGIQHRLQRFQRRHAGGFRSLVHRLVEIAKATALVRVDFGKIDGLAIEQQFGFALDDLFEALDGKEDRLKRRFDLGYKGSVFDHGAVLFIIVDYIHIHFLQSCRHQPRLIASRGFVVFNCL